MEARALKLPQDELAAFCRRHRIVKLALFGSALREDFNTSSDADFLIEFESLIPSFRQALAEHPPST